MTIVCTCLVAISFGIVITDDYPRPQLLIEADALKKTDDAKGTRILDARDENAYRLGHMPGAVWLDPAKWSKRFAEGQNTSEWTRLIGELGIDIDTPVVIYDDSHAKDAARMWWILRYWGVKNAKLLNGGWKAWQSSNGEISKVTATVKKTTPKLVAEKDRLAAKDHVWDAIKSKKYQIIDARSKDEHCGLAGTAKRKGAVPGAVNRDWTDLVDPKTGRFKSAAELTRIFNESGIDPVRPTMTYCQSGGRSSVMAFALELMGGNDVRNYYRSWAEWGNAEDTPIVKPEPKK